MSEPNAGPPGWAPELNVRARGRHWTLRAGSGYHIGRDPRAAIVLDDLRVSWRHALLRPAGGTWVLEDNGSTNGTWVGTERVSRIEIRGILVVCLGDPADGAVVRFAPEPPARQPRCAAAGRAGILPAWIR